MKTLSLLSLLALCACKISSKSPKPASLYGTWQVASIATPERLATGEEMGNPQYTFQNNGYRIKAYLSPAFRDSVAFVLRGDSIFYPENPKLPPVKILKLQNDSLVLESPSALWRLYR